MDWSMLRGILVVAATWLAACAPEPTFSSSSDGPPAATIFVASNGWHTSIVLPAAMVRATGMAAEIAAFPDAAYLEFGWGDREYYPEPRPTIGQGIAALMTPTPSVLHVASLDGPPVQVYVDSEVLAVPLSADGVNRLIAGIDAEFDRSGENPAAAVGPGLYPNSLFFPAKGRFHLFNTCNTWTARRLKEAGLGISPAGVKTAGDMMERLRNLPGVEPVPL